MSPIGVRIAWKRTPVGWHTPCIHGVYEPLLASVEHDMFPSLLVLIACAPSFGPEAQQATDDTIPTAGPGPTELQFTDPMAGAYLRTGPQQIMGIGRHLTEVLVDGQAARLSDGMFLVDRDVRLGLNTFSATGTDKAGAVYHDTASVLAGEFKAPEGVIGDALQVHVSTASLSGLGSVFGSLLDPATLGAELQAQNPLVDTREAELNLGVLSFGTPVIELVPRTGVLDLTIVLPDFVLPLEATIRDALPFGIDLEIGVDLASEEVRLTVPLRLGTDNGKLDVQVGQLSAELTEFNLDTGILEIIDWMFVDDDDLAVAIESALGGMGPQINTMVQGLLGGLDLEIETELMEQQVSLSPRFDQVDVTPSGLSLALGVALDVAGAEGSGPGHLTLAPPPPMMGQDVRVQIADDFLNRALYELWAGGALDIDLPLGAEEAAILLLFGGAGTGHLRMSSALPPVWVEENGVGRLQLGEIALTVETPGGQYGDLLEIVMALDAKADFAVSAEAAGVVLTDGRVVMRLAGDSVDNAALAEKLPGIATAFGVGIGFVNEMLTFPLTDVLPAGTVLPPITLVRDPSTRGSVVDLSAEDLSALLPLLTGETPPPPPPPLPPNAVPVPATAEVLDQDEDRTTDGDVAWVCERDDITTVGNGGTWYLAPDSSLVIAGTGHTVYASDGAEVILEMPGNTVFHDPAANVDDRDGTNTVLVVDPLSLDLAAAPVPGCP